MSKLLKFIWKYTTRNSANSRIPTAQSDVVDIGRAGYMSLKS